MNLWSSLTRHAGAVNAIFAAVIAIATVAYTVATICYTRISSEQFGATQEALRQDRRAYVVLKSDIPPGLIKPNEQVLTDDTYTNTGKTAAKNIVSDIVIKIMPNDGSIPRFDYSAPHIINKIPLLQADTSKKSQTLWVREGKEMVPLLPSQADIDELTAGRAYLMIYAKVVYRDIYGVEHWQHLCVWRPYAEVGFSSGACAAYNDVDNN
jgi:hypothetical protein